MGLAENNCLRDSINSVSLGVAGADCGSEANNQLKER